MTELTSRKNILNDGNDDTVPGRFFYITLIPNEENPLNVLTPKATEIYSSFNAAVAAYHIIETKVSEMQPYANIIMAKKVPDAAIGCSDVIVGNDLGSKITLWCIDRRGETLH